MSYPQVTVCKHEPPLLIMELEQLGYEVRREGMKGRDFEGQTIIGEIKRDDDLFTSIVDKRLFTQAKRMYQTGKQAFLILAGTMGDPRYRLKPVVGALLTVVFDYGIGVIPVPANERIIAWVIHQIMTKVDGRKPHPSEQAIPRARDLTTNITHAMLCMIPGIGRKQARVITQVYPTMEKLLEAQKAELEQLDGIGPKRATTVFEALRQG